MVENDGNLSLDDAKKILNQFIVEPKTKKKKPNK
jgi:hypothetical protein